MCTLCAEFRPFNKEDECDFTPEGAPKPIPLLAEITEGSVDASSNTSTQYEMAVGDTFVGSLSVGDSDWVEIDLTSGNTYEITLDGTGSNALSDPYLTIYDANGRQVTFNDDGGPGLNSRLTFTATSTSRYYIEAGSYNDNYAGSYTVAVTEADPLDFWSTDEIAEQLTDGYWQFNGQSRRAFDVAPGGELTVNLTDLSSARAALARDALDAWTFVTGINFRETSGSANIDFGDSDSGAYAQTFTSGSRITSSNINVATNWQGGESDPDNYTFQTFVHEIGHAIGLGHAGNYNGNASYGTDNNYLNDSWQASIMSYFSQTENTNINASYAYIVTPMMADIAAVHDLYGAPSDQRTGNTTYGENSNAGGYYDDIIDYSRPVAFTILDDGGTDTIDLSSATVAQRIDLRPGMSSDVLGLQGNMFIWRDSVIENAIGGTRDDTITGNNANNLLRGEAGNDVLTLAAGNDVGIGGTGNDTITGGNGNDTLDGGDGNDRLDGGAGRDVARFWGTGDVTVDLSIATGQNTGRGTDTLISIEGALTGAGADLVRGNGAANQISLGEGNDRGLGFAGNDTINGGGGNDKLKGGDGNDELRGGNGNDRLFGADGADHLIGGAGNDKLNAGRGVENDIYDGGAGRDTAQVAVSVDLTIDLRITGAQSTGAGSDQFTGIEGIIAGGGDDDLIGNAEDNTLQGRNGSDLLRGYSGNDRLLGGGGRDQLSGGNGRDQIVGGTSNDTLTGGSGADRFVFETGDGRDSVTDFQDGLDMIEISAAGFSFADVTISDRGANAEITVSDVTIILENVDHRLITAEDFTFG